MTPSAKSVFEVRKEFPYKKGRALPVGEGRHIVFWDDGNTEDVPDFKQAGIAVGGYPPPPKPRELQPRGPGEHRYME